MASHLLTNGSRWTYTSGWALCTLWRQVTFPHSLKLNFQSWTESLTEGKTHAGTTGTLRTSGSRRTRWTLSVKRVNHQWRTTASICIHHNYSQSETEKEGFGSIWIDVCPFLLPSRVSPTQEKLKKSSNRSAQSPTTSSGTWGTCWKRRQRRKNPQQFKSHHGSDVSVLSLLAGGSGQTLPRRQTNTHSFTETKVKCEQ